MTTVVCVKKKQLQLNGYIDFNDWNSNPNNLYIGRRVNYVNGTFTSKWHNPFSAKEFGRDGCIKKYEEYLISSGLLDDIQELHNKELGCWCKPEACHGDILMRYANS